MTCIFSCALPGLLAPGPHFALVPGLRLLSAAGCDLLVLGFDLSHDLLHVQAAAVVHLHHHRGVLDAVLQLTQLLETQKQRWSLDISSKGYINKITGCK